MKCAICFVVARNQHKCRAREGTSVLYINDKYRHTHIHKMPIIKAIATYTVIEKIKEIGDNNLITASWEWWAVTVQQKNKKKWRRDCVVDVGGVDYVDCAKQQTIWPQCAECICSFWFVCEKMGRFQLVDGELIITSSIAGSTISRDVYLHIAHENANRFDGNLIKL